MPATATASPAAVPSQNLITRANWLQKSNIALATTLWVWLGCELWFEWSHSEQYGYGLFVPFLTAYLVWLRSLNCPTAQPRGRDGPVLAVLLLVALAHYPITVIFAANADWRLLAWSEALVAMGTTAFLLARWGGWPWVRHFIPALALFLFAVPWPSFIEIPLVYHMMTFVASITTEALNLLGYQALRSGHIIQLPNGMVSVEEACSGVRSMQSTIMAGWLVGEWWHFRPKGRIALLLWAVVVAMLFNLLRTFSLAYLCAADGPTTMEKWHDTAGYLVFGFSFSTVLVGAWLAHRFFHRPLQTASNATTTKAPAPCWLPTKPVVAVLGLLLAAWPASLVWYAWREPNIAIKPGWHLNLAIAAPQAKLVEPLPSLKEALFYDQGEQASWADASGQIWSLYYLQWSHARAAQLGGVHSPESCLPAVGWVQIQQGENLVWARGNLKLIFNTYEFVHWPFNLYVYYCQWDPAGYDYYDKTGRFRIDRLMDAWRGDRKQGKQLLELAIDHSPSMAAATETVKAFLDQAIVEIPPTKSAP